MNMRLEQYFDIIRGMGYVFEGFFVSAYYKAGLRSQFISKETSRKSTEDLRKDSPEVP